MQIIRRYPLSLLCIALLWVLCFCHPPQTSMDGVPGIDKLAHVVMYLGTCGIMWWEYLRHHKVLRLRHAVKCTSPKLSSKARQASSSAL